MVDLNRRTTIQLLGIGIASNFAINPSSANTGRENVFIKPKRGRKSEVLDSLPVDRPKQVQYRNFDFIAANIPSHARSKIENNRDVEYVEDDHPVEITRSFNDNILDEILSRGNNRRNNSRDARNETKRTIEESTDIQSDEEDIETDNDCSEPHPTQSTPWGVDRINATDSEYTGKNVNVAILDTGIETSHCNLSVSGGRNFTNNGSDNDYEDRHGHGTHVAGTVAALDNGYGVRGVAPESNLYALKVLNDDGTGLQSWMALAIDWCISNNIEIINLSLGSPSGSSAMNEVISKAYDEGHLLIASAGNDGNSGDCSANNVSYPATHEKVMSVSAMNQDNTLADYSSVGSEVEIMAPGTNIRSTYIDNSYASTSGTSMAAPHVSGVAAQHWESNSSNSPGPNVQIRNAINEQAVEILSSCTEGNGLVMSLIDENDNTYEEDDEEELETQGDDEQDEIDEEPEDDDEDNVNDEPEEDDEQDEIDEDDENYENDTPASNVSERTPGRRARNWRRTIRERVSSWFRR